MEKKKIVRCIETNLDDCRDMRITYGKEYEVIEEHYSLYFITLDTGEKGGVYKFRFEVVNQKTQNNMNNQQQTFAVYSKNQKLLFAFLDTCIELGMPEEKGMNDEHRKYKTVDHIYFGSRLQIHNHSCDAEAIYNLPQDWDAALEKAKEIYLASKYTGKWKVGDEITIDQLNYAPENSIVHGDREAFNARSFYNPSRIIEAIKAINGTYYGEISDTSSLWINLDQIPTQDEVLLAKAIKELKLKVGDKIYVRGCRYIYSSYDFVSGFISTRYDTVDSFTIKNGEPCVCINQSKEFFYVPIKDIIEKKQPIIISDYEAEVVTENGVKLIKFGCKRFTKQSLASHYSLLCNQGSEMKVDLKINDTQITLEMIEKLINMLD
jgi:hypothetical protein